MLLQKYKDVRVEIEHGDLLLFRRRGLISIVGRGVHSHAAMAAWWGDRLFVLETLQFHGGRAVTLSSQVDRNSGLWDCYEANAEDRWPDFQKGKAVNLMKSFCGTPYGWFSVLCAAARHLPLVRLLLKPDILDDAVNTRPLFCSQAVMVATRIGGGVDPVSGLSDRLTEPADLARSPFYRYKFTLES